MANLGFQAIYGLTNRLAGIRCERAFLPEAANPKKTRESPDRLFSLESRRPLTEFALLAFSVSFEGDYPHILEILHRASIPLKAEERLPSHPLILAGGAAVTMNPEPLAPFFDLILIGEGEELWPEFLSAYNQLKNQHARGDLPFALACQVRGVYTPSGYRISPQDPSRLVPVIPGLPARVVRRHVADLDGHPTHEWVHTRDSEFGSMYLIEVNRGCGRGCRFCVAGFLYRPPRFRRYEALAPLLTSGVKEKGKVGLVGTAVSDHPDLRQLQAHVLALGGKLGIGSLRLDRINEETLRMLKEGGVESIALAPEAGTQRLRQVINKGIQEEDIRRAAELLSAYGFLNLRLYFLVGLPTETQADIDGIIALVGKFDEWAKKKGHRAFRHLVVSINQFIPKPATPFQWLPLEAPREIKKKITRIRQALAKNRKIEIIAESPRAGYQQALLSLGDRGTAELLLAVHRLNGCWEEALKQTGFAKDTFVFRRKSFDEALPWEIIDHGLRREYLVAECERALAGAQETPADGKIEDQS
jgi:radical SAM superfamily enzyme YgiQ (UPF0313 family)